MYTSSLNKPQLSQITELSSISSHLSKLQASIFIQHSAQRVTTLLSSESNAIPPPAFKDTGNPRRSPAKPQTAPRRGSHQWQSQSSHGDTTIFLHAGVLGSSSSSSSLKKQHHSPVQEAIQYLSPYRYHLRCHLQPQVSCPLTSSYLVSHSPSLKEAPWKKLAIHRSLHCRWPDDGTCSLRMISSGR